MKRTIEKFLEYLRSVKYSSPHTVANYAKDLGQFQAYLTPPGAQPPELRKIHHRLIREFVGHLHEACRKPPSRANSRRSALFSNTAFAKATSAIIPRASFPHQNFPNASPW
jgi:site-specific recombinase XerD